MLMSAKESSNSKSLSCLYIEIITSPKQNNLPAMSVLQGHIMNINNQIHGQYFSYASILNTPPPNGETILSILPAEIIQHILSFLLESGNVIDITLRDRKPGRMSSFKTWFPGFYSRPLFNVCRDLTEQSIQHLFGNNLFASKNAMSFQDLPRAMGVEWVANIRNLELKNHYRYITDPGRFWPRQLEFLTTKMPQLAYFRLGNDFASDAIAHASTTGSSRLKQEIRALIGFGAFVILRHPLLQIMIWPELSGQSTNGRTFVAVILKSSNVRVGSNNNFLNSRAIRRCSWKELHDMDINNFFLSRDVTTSEGAEPGTLLETDCELIDKFGYLTVAKQRKLGHRGQPYILARMIHQAKVNKSQRLREERDERDRRERDTTDLERRTPLAVDRNGRTENGVRGNRRWRRGAGRVWGQNFG